MSKLSQRLTTLSKFNLPKINATFYSIITSKILQNLQAYVLNLPSLTTLNKYFIDNSSKTIESQILSSYSIINT